MNPLTLSELQQRLESLHAVELEHLVADALTADGYTVVQEPSGHRYDISAKKDGTEFAIEVRRQARPGPMLLDVVSRALSSAPPRARRILAIPDLVDLRRSHSWAALLDSGVEIWGLPQLGDLLERAGLLPTILQDSASRRRGTRSDDLRPRAESLRARLHGTAPGPAGAIPYQVLCTEIAEFLFAPSLGPPDKESSDDAKRNRRDFVMENLAESGFWNRARTQYQADYIVFDAKNYSGAIKKRSVIEISHYLTPYGLGLFGILMTRAGGSSAARHAAQHQWISARRMIVILDDEIVHQMIEEKASGRAPELALGDWLADFRKGL